MSKITRESSGKYRYDIKTLTVDIQLVSQERVTDILVNMHAKKIT